MSKKRENPAHVERAKALGRFLIEEYALIHINPQVEGVVIPEYLTAQPTVTLKVSKFFRGPIHIDADHLTAELSFKGEPFACTVPFDAIWAMTSLKGEKVLWADAAHPEVQAVLRSALALDPKIAPAPLASSASPSRTTEKSSPSSSSSRVRRIRPALALAPRAVPTEEPQPDPEPPPRSPKRRRAAKSKKPDAGKSPRAVHLKRVK